MSKKMKIAEILLFVFFFSQACDALLEDHETKDLLNSQFNLLIIDGSFPECGELFSRQEVTAPNKFKTTN